MAGIPPGNLVSLALFGGSLAAWKCAVRDVKESDNRSKTIPKGSFHRPAMTVSLNSEIDCSDFMLMGPSVTTVTFYQGQPCTTYLRERFSALIAKNTWLAGNLCKDEEGYYIDNRGGPQVIDDLFFEANQPDLSEDMDYATMTEILRNYMAPNGIDCLLQVKKMVRLTVITISPNKFAITLSINHVLADGFTYYKLYGMLSMNLPVESLDAERVPNFLRDFDEKMVGNDSRLWFGSLGQALNIKRTIKYAGPVKCFLREIQPSWLAHEKLKHEKEFRSESSFVSTNDILVSTMFKITRCDVGMMALNLRNRMGGITKQLAGNYHGLLAFQQKDYEQPYLIRRSLCNDRNIIRRAVSGSLPGFLRSLIATVTVTTNWASFYEDVELPNCTMLGHYPVVDNRVVAVTDVCVFFRPSRDRLAMICFARSFDESDLEQHGMVFLKNSGH